MLISTESPVPARDRRHVIFATNSQLDLLGKAKTWYMDATLKVVRQPFTQLLSIHAFVKAENAMERLTFMLRSDVGEEKKRHIDVFLGELWTCLKFIPSAKLIIKAIKTYVLLFSLKQYSNFRGPFHQTS